MFATLFQNQNLLLGTQKRTHCSNPKKVLNENDTPQFLQFPFVHTREAKLVIVEKICGHPLSSSVP